MGGGRLWKMVPYEIASCNDGPVQSGSQNPRTFTLSWALEYGIQLRESGFQVPLTRWNPEFST